MSLSPRLRNLARGNGAAAAGCRDKKGTKVSQQIRIEYGVILPTWPDATVVVKPEGEDRLLVFVGQLVKSDAVVPTNQTRPECSCDECVEQP